MTQPGHAPTPAIQVSWAAIPQKVLTEGASPLPKTHLSYLSFQVLPQNPRLADILLLLKLRRLPLSPSLLFSHASPYCRNPGATVESLNFLWCSCAQEAEPPPPSDPAVQAPSPSRLWICVKFKERQEYLATALMKLHQLPLSPASHPKSTFNLKV